MMHQAERVVVGARKVTPGGTSKLGLRRRVPTGNLKVRIPQLPVGRALASVELSLRLGS
jgi:hypothetical protein